MSAKPAVRRTSSVEIRRRNGGAPIVSASCDATTPVTGIPVDRTRYAQLLADTHERRAAIKRRYYERQLGMMKVIVTLTLTLTLSPPKTQI